MKKAWKIISGVMVWAVVLVAVAMMIFTIIMYIPVFVKMKKETAH